MKLKNEPYRCGECKLKSRILLHDSEGNYLKDSLGNYVYETFISDTAEQMLAHLEISHDLNASDSNDYGQCFDCLYWYSFDNLPCGYDSAGGLILWCYDCTQKRCLGYSNMRRYIISILERNGIEASGKMSNDELLQKLTEL